MELSFGDSGTSTDRYPLYTYNTEGTYAVSLTAASASGNDTLVRTDYITVPEPSAMLQLVSGCLGLLVLNARHRRGRAHSQRRTYLNPDRES